MRAFGIVVHAPGRERGAGMVQGREQGLVQKLVALLTVEALDEGVLGRLAERDVVPVDLSLLGEGQDRVRCQFGADFSWQSQRDSALRNRFAAASFYQ